MRIGTIEIDIELRQEKIIVADPVAQTQQDRAQR
jgi:hypothetical protein